MAHPSRVQRESKRSPKSLATISFPEEELAIVANLDVIAIGHAGLLPIFDHCAFLGSQLITAETRAAKIERARVGNDLNSSRPMARYEFAGFDRLREL